jgi:phosphatidylserine/phosphatidylglycerophosphate/cardiolipin synthase-like enzyme
MHYSASRITYRVLTLNLIFALCLIFLSLQVFAEPIAPKLNEANLKHFATLYNLETKKPVRLIQDNVTAFQEKLKIVRNAKEALDLMYFIYSDDESSSYFSKELIKVAQRGIKVRVLLDYITNYKLLDTLIAIQSEAAKTGRGSIEFRFFGRPTPNIIRDVIYMTTPCNDDLTHESCVQLKTAAANQLIDIKRINNSTGSQKQELLAQAQNANSLMSGIFLSGIYGKSGNTLKFLFHHLGYDKKLIELKKQAKLSTEKKEEAKKLIQLYLKSKAGDRDAALKLKIATLFFGEDIDDALELISEVLPVGLDGVDSNRIKDWDHFTDYLHHKFLLADNGLTFDLMIGGRNIENSYHMQKNPSGKYTFVDTDATTTLGLTSGFRMQASFDKLWNFTEMTASLQDVLQHAPNDTQVALSQCEILDAACAAKVPRTIEAVIASRAERVKNALFKLNKLSEDFLSSKYKSFNQPKKPELLSIDKSIDTEAKISYIENLPFDKSGGHPKRKYGAQVDSEELSGKYIHKIWANALLDTCGPEKGAQNIYLHSAYVVFPTPLLSAIAEMTKTSSPSNVFNSFTYLKRDCSNVTIKIITNSVETTDLSVINVFARVQMHALLQTISKAQNETDYQKYQLQNKAAKIEYYEVIDPNTLKPDSLHTKISILGANAIIGSANADVRSYMMDTNNGFYIENAPHFVKNYGSFLEEQIKDSRQTQRLDLQWRSGAINTNISYISGEISILIRKIQYLLRDRKWTKDKYFKSLENIFAGVFLDDIINSTMISARTFPISANKSSTIFRPLITK